MIETAGPRLDREPTSNHQIKTRMPAATQRTETVVAKGTPGLLHVGDKNFCVYEQRAC